MQGIHVSSRWLFTVCVIWITAIPINVGVINTGYLSSKAISQSNNQFASLLHLVDDIRRHPRQVVNWRHVDCHCCTPDIIRWCESWFRFGERILHAVGKGVFTVEVKRGLVHDRVIQNTGSCDSCIACLCVLASRIRTTDLTIYLNSEVTDVISVG